MARRGIPSLFGVLLRVKAAKDLAVGEQAVLDEVGGSRQGRWTPRAWPRCAPT